MKYKATGCDSISTVFSSIVLLCGSIMIIIIIIIIVIIIIIKIIIIIVITVIIVIIKLLEIHFSFNSFITKIPVISAA